MSEATPSRPRVHWVSPIPAAETDIAHYTARILPEMAEACDLTLWTDATSWSAELDRHTRVRRANPDHIMPRDFAATSGAKYTTKNDVIFIHIGNSWVFHAGLLRLARRIPSVIVLHDLAIQEMLFDAIANKLFDPNIYLREMSQWYGPDGRARAEAVLQGKERPISLAKDMPGFELVLNRAAAVLTHTPAAFEAVSARGVVPAYQLDLPFRPSAQVPSAARSADGPLRFVQFGYIGPNRRLEEVLEALGPLAGEIDFEFDIMGKVWDTAYVHRRISEFGLEDRVRIHGFVPEAELDARLAEAHLVFNLRYPTMGEASGSQLRIWNASAAAVVTDLGWYGSLPDETVFKIPQGEGERAALQAMIRALNTDRTLAAKKGTAGRAQLEARHTPQIYAEAVAYVANCAAKDLSSRPLIESAKSVISLNEAVISSPALYRDRLARHQLG